MLAVIKVAHQRNALVIFSGDTSQHSSVNRGDALRLLHEVAGVEAVSSIKYTAKKDRNTKKLLSS